MTFSYNKLKTKTFVSKIKIQPITIDIIKKELKKCIVNCPFSTFPYIYEHMNSNQAIRKRSSGNCIGLSKYIQLKLKHKGIYSFLIPATVPASYYLEGYLDLSHVALAVPKDKNTIFVLDAAFYFEEPIVVDFTDNTKMVYTYNVYTGAISNANYTQHKTHELVKFNKYQTMLKNTVYVTCNYIDKPGETWNYYLTEIVNPDAAITSFFINIKIDPFICIIDDNYKLKLYIKLQNGNIKIQYYNDIIYNGTVLDIPDDIITIIQPIVNKYVDISLLTNTISSNIIKFSNK
jgi:hypothetical protein